MPNLSKVNLLPISKPRSTTETSNAETWQCTTTGANREDIKINDQILGRNSDNRCAKIERQKYGQSVSRLAGELTTYGNENCQNITHIYIDFVVTGEGYTGGHLKTQLRIMLSNDISCLYLYLYLFSYLYMSFSPYQIHSGNSKEIYSK